MERLGMYESDKDDARGRKIVRTSVIGIVTNVLLAAFKAAVGLFSHSIAIVLDAVNNLSDAASSLITIVGTKLALKAPDKKHPFGYGRLEYLSSMVIAVIVLYAVGMTVVVSYGMDTRALYLPLVLCGFGHVGVFIVLTVYAQATANFKYYFEILCLLGFIRTGVGAPIGDAIYSTALTGLMTLRPDLELAVRELYGYSVIFGVFVLALIVASRFKRQIYSTVPLIQSIYVAALRKWSIPSFARRKGE